MQAQEKDPYTFPYPAPWTATTPVNVHVWGWENRWHPLHPLHEVILCTTCASISCSTMQSPSWRRVKAFKHWEADSPVWYAPNLRAHQKKTGLSASQCLKAFTLLHDSDCMVLHDIDAHVVHKITSWRGWSGCHLFFHRCTFIFTGVVAVHGAG